MTTAVVDPHEVANVAGVAGIRYLAESSRDLPLDAIFMAPSSVPATDLQAGGATLSADDLADLLADGTVHGLAEVMNYPGVVAGDPEVLRKIELFRGRPIDGHAPGLSGAFLNAYVAAGIGSDHECTSVEEAREKLARGLYILIREATNARNLHTLLPLVTARNSRRICFCTDDRIPTDLLAQGSIDYMVREAIAYGIDPVEAVRMGDAEHRRMVRTVGPRCDCAGATGGSGCRRGPARIRPVPGLQTRRTRGARRRNARNSAPVSAGCAAVGSQQRQRRLGSRPLPGAGPGQAHSHHRRSGGPARHR